MPHYKESIPTLQQNISINRSWDGIYNTGLLTKDAPLMTTLNYLNITRFRNNKYRNILNFCRILKPVSNTITKHKTEFTPDLTAQLRLLCELSWNNNSGYTVSIIFISQHNFILEMLYMWLIASLPSPWAPQNGLQASGFADEYLKDCITI